MGWMCTYALRSALSMAQDVKGLHPRSIAAPRNGILLSFATKKYISCGIGLLKRRVSHKDFENMTYIVHSAYVFRSAPTQTAGAYARIVQAVLDHSISYHLSPNSHTVLL